MGIPRNEAACSEIYAASQRCLGLKIISTFSGYYKRTIFIYYCFGKFNTHIQQLTALEVCRKQIVFWKLIDSKKTKTFVKWSLAQTARTESESFSFVGK